MAIATTSKSDLTDDSPELLVVVAVLRLAEQQAVLLRRFFLEIGLPLRSGEPPETEDVIEIGETIETWPPFPPTTLSCSLQKFFLDLGAAVYLRHWERLGWNFHREAGLPSADRAVRDAFEAGIEGEGDPEGPTTSSSLSRDVMSLYLKHFAWLGTSHIKAEVHLGTVEEGQLLDALAAFLYKNPRALGGNRRGELQ